MNQFDDLKTNVNVQEFAKNLAQSDDFKQSDFINKFAYELRVVCRDIDFSGMQPCNIADKLDKNGVDFINGIAEFIKLRDQFKTK